MTSFAIRPATVDDARGIAAVHVTTWQDAYRGIVPDAYLDALDIEERARRWRSGLAEDEAPTWVAEEGGRVIGWSTTGASRDTDENAAPGELYGIYVSSDRWGTGVGPALMEQCLSWLRERYAAATLWTLEANPRARAFYERYGWQTDGTTKQDDGGTFVLHEVRYRIDL